jgi:hypothetical protein
MNSKKRRKKRWRKRMTRAVFDRLTEVHQFLS